MTLATLSIDLVAHVAKFEGDMGKIARATDKASQQIVSSLGAAKAAIGGLAAGVSVAGLLSLGKATIDSLDALNDLKDATGASIENISALEDVAARTGTSMDTVATSLVKFNGVLKDAKPGSDAEAALTALGLSAKELQALDPADALLKTATALGTFADDGNKARITQELFGKSLKEVAPFLKDLAEKGELVATVTTEQAQVAEDFNKQLFELQKNSQNAARSLAGEFVPALTEILRIYNGGGFISAIDAIGNKLFDWEGSQQRKTIGRIKSELDELKTSYAGVTVDVFGAKGDLAKQIEAKTADLVKAQAEYYKYANGNAGRGKVNPANVDVRTAVGGIPDKAKPVTKGQDPDADFAAYLKRLDEQITKTVELTAVEQLAFDIQNKRVTLSAAQEEELRLRATIIDEIKAETEATKALDEAKKTATAYLAGLAKETQALEDNNKQLALHVEEIGLTKVQLNALTLARMDEAIAAAEQARSLVNLQNSSEQEIATIERKIELLKEQRNITANGQIAQATADDKDAADKASKDFADTLNNDLKGAFSAAFRDTSGEPLKAFGDAVANVLYSRAATALANAAASAILPDSSSGKSNTSDVSSLFKLASIIMPSFDGGGFSGTGARSGGLDGKGGFMAMLHPNETVLDHTRGQRAGGGSSVTNYYMTVGDVASASMVQKAIANSERRMASAMGRSMQYGGALS